MVKKLPSEIRERGIRSFADLLLDEFERRKHNLESRDERYSFALEEKDAKTLVKRPYSSGERYCC